MANKVEERGTKNRKAKIDKSIKGLTIDYGFDSDKQQDERQKETWMRLRCI
jgi:hypothetical protein